MTSKAKSLLKGLAAALGKQFQDGVVNTLTGVGTSTDKTTWNAFCYDYILDLYTLEELYASNDLAGTIVDKIVDDALRDGFTLEKVDGDPSEDTEATSELLRRWDEIQQGEARFAKAASWGRLMGGGLILGVQGSGSFASPLDPERVTKVDFILDFDRQQMQPVAFYKDGSVKTWLYTPKVPFPSTATLEPIEIHETRVIIFPGARTTISKKQQNGGWDLSVLQRVYAALLSFESAWKSTDAMFADASQAVFHIQGLISALAEDTGKDDVQTRLRIMSMTRSTHNAVVLDAGDEGGTGREDFKVVDRASLGGLDGVIGQYMVRLAAAARMPLTVLLGTAPKGMNATGESDMNLWYGTVDVYRKQVLAPRIAFILYLLSKENRSDGIEDAAKYMASKAPEVPAMLADWVIVWPELQKQKPLDAATEMKMRVDTALGLVTNQVALPEEVALSLCKIAPGLRLTLDTKSRKEALSIGLEEVANRELGEPEEVPGQTPGSSTSTQPSTSGRQVKASTSGNQQ